MVNVDKRYIIIKVNKKCLYVPLISWCDRFRLQKYTPGAVFTKGLSQVLGLSFV